MPVTWWAVAGPLAGLALAPLLDRFIPWLPHEPAAYTDGELVLRRRLLLVLTPLLFLAAALRFGDDVRTPVLLVYTAWALAVGAIDLEHRLIHHVMVVPALLAAPLLAWLWGVGVLGMVLGFATAFGFFLLSYLGTRLLFHAEGVALGDLYLAAIIGTLTGFPRAFLALLAMSVLSGVVSGFLLLSRRRTARDYIPFAPFILAGAWVALFLST